jgi:phosphoglycolate phosphatase-like HAD superfamily hydrolase
VAEAAYVGDSPSDIQAALAAGVEAIGVTWGVFDTAALAAEKPDILVHTIPELAEVLGI